MSRAANKYILCIYDYDGNSQFGIHTDKSLAALETEWKDVLSKTRLLSNGYCSVKFYKHYISLIKSNTYKIVSLEEFFDMSLPENK